jgi:hypothetical protein
MIRTILFAAAILAGLQMLAMGQTKNTAAKAEVLCCGQEATAVDARSPQQIRQATQKTLQSILMKRTRGQLSAGDHLIVKSSKGHELRAVVSRQGIVNQWYVRDGRGGMVARMKNDGGGVDPDKIEKCMNRFIACAQVGIDADKFGEAPIYVGLHLSRCWDAFFACLSEIRGGATIR